MNFELLQGVNVVNETVFEASRFLRFWEFMGHSCSPQFVRRKGFDSVIISEIALQVPSRQVQPFVKLTGPDEVIIVSSLSLFKVNLVLYQIPFHPFPHRLSRLDFNKTLRVNSNKIKFGAFVFSSSPTVSFFSTFSCCFQNPSYCPT